MSNVGEKIRGLVVFLVVIGLLASLIYFFVGNTAYNKNKSYIIYATVNGGGYYSSDERKGNEAYNGLQQRNHAIIMGLSICISALPLYGFGVLVECSERKMYLLTQLLEEQKKTNEHLLNQQQESATTEGKQKQEEVKDVSAYLPEL